MHNCQPLYSNVKEYEQYQLSLTLHTYHKQIGKFTATKDNIFSSWSLLCAYTFTFALVIRSNYADGRHAAVSGHILNNYLLY